MFAQTTSAGVLAQYQAVTDSLHGSFSVIAAMPDDAEPDLTAFTQQPRAHWHKVWSNNPIVCLNREIKRRADVAQIFPNRNSVTRLICAVLQEQHEEWGCGERNYFIDISMRKLVYVFNEHTEPAHPDLYLSA